MRKRTKIGLVISSAAAIVLAGSIMAGGTYALFTSESKVNIAVTSGEVNLMASIEDLIAYSPKLISSESGNSIIESENIADNTGDIKVFGNGGTAQYEDSTLSLNKLTPGDKINFSVKVENKSNVSAKYRVVINCAEDDGLYNGLNICAGSEKLLFNEDKKSYFAWKELSLEDLISELPLSIELPTTAGNDYQNKTCEFLITVEAIQGNAKTEDESNSLLYISNSADNSYFADLLAKDTLGDNTTNIVYRNYVSEEDKTTSHLIPQTYINSDSTINLSGKTIKTDSSNSESYGEASPVLVQVQNGATLTINDADNSGTITCETGEMQVYGINVKNGKVVVNGGNYYGAITAIQVTEGELEINGGFFDLAPTCKSLVPQYAKYVVNCIDRSFKDGTAKISIKGGTFVNFNPSTKPEGNDTTYVAEGYKVTSSTHGSDTWYTVVKDES